MLDIGPGCGELALHIVDATDREGQLLTVIDSPEMLSQLPERTHLTKLEGPFPACLQTLARPLGPFDAILVYSVAHHVFLEASLFGFVDAAVQLLGDQGRLLVGDIPNATMRKRFMASPAGKAYHAAHYAHLPEPKTQMNTLDPGEIDDGVVLGLLARMRAAGLHAFAVPQPPELPMANRREDILIVRP
jgi:cyclopropane fatty-acyl-phospholipid synthase-like methyltransferase